jgi:ParB-like nuclease domain
MGGRIVAKYKELELPLDDLLLDPNNFRFQDEEGYITAEDSRFHEPTVQDRAYRRMRSEGLVELKNSILTNGFLAVERLVVRRYPHRDSKYVVVEGNRRLAALRWIRDDNDAGVSIPGQVLATLGAIPVVLIEADEDESIYLSLMGIRHVSGIRQWGGYQRAKLVTELRDRHGLESTEIGSRLGMSTQEVNRRYRAFKALEQMQQDEEYGDRATPSMYLLFHEAVSAPVIRQWLGWHDTTNNFDDDEERTRFYELITPFEGDEGEPSHEAKISTFSQVRELKTILPNPEAKRVLFEHDRSFHEGNYSVPSPWAAG